MYTIDWLKYNFVQTYDTIDLVKKTDYDAKFKDIDKNILRLLIIIILQAH